MRRAAIPPLMIVTRFAPSPTGHLHIGHAHSALAGWRAAKGGGGRFLLRIEDIDPGRCRPEYEAAIHEDLAWLGLAWEMPVRRQSEHLADYRAALARLDAIGVLYPCFCSRKDIQAEIAASGQAPHDPAGPRYAGICRALPRAEAEARIAAGRPHALRLDAAKAAAITGPLTWQDLGRGIIPVDPLRLGDVVLARRDVPASYHLAVTVDDALQGVTLVTRGEDLACASHVHRLLQALLGLAPLIYRHHLLLRNEAGARLAKRDGALALRALRAAGRMPAEVRAMAGSPD